MIQAPVDPTTGLSRPLEQSPAPIAPTPVAQSSNPISTPPAPLQYTNNPDGTPIVQAEVKPPAPIKTEVASSVQKTETPIDYTQAKGREGEIQANLDSFKAK